MSITSGSSKSPKAGRATRSRGGVPLDAQPIVTGWLARESGVVSSLLNRRYAALYPSLFVTYRKENDDLPSKEWRITRDVQVSQVQSEKFHLRHAKTSTLYAVVAGAYKTLQMFAFSVSWPHGSDITGPDRLVLAFETKEEADQWHGAFSDAISKAEAADHALRTSSTASESSAGLGPSSGPPASLPMQDRGGSAAGAAAVPARPAGGATEPRGRSWASVLHINGIAVYQEEEDGEGEGGAIMVSAVVRSSPDEVLRNLIQQRKTEGTGVFTGARVLEVIDSHTQIVSQQWKPSGLVGSFCAVREMVLLRTWRKDEDGTYIVLYQSTHHRSAREVRGGGGGWFCPVRAQVQAAGFTIAPLMPKYTNNGESRECLVTLVLKADLGGSLSGESLAARALGRLCSYAVQAVLEPVVTSIVILRDKVEQDRFVVRPLSMTRGEEEQEAAAADAAAGRRGAMRLRTATMLAYRREPLLLAQQHAAESGAVARVSSVTAVRLTPEGLPAPPAAEAAPAPVAEDMGDAWAIGGTCDRKFWTSPGSGGFKVRGPGYLLDKKKVPSPPPMFELVAVDLLELEEPMFHVCERLPSVRHSPAPFLFCVQLMVPSSPPISLVVCWAAPMPVMGLNAAALTAQFEEQQGPCPDNVVAFFKTFTEFLEGDGPEADKLRNSKFKLIPNISKGSWIIKQSVGTTPVLLGSKLTTKYFRGPNYFEVDVDIGSSSVAASVTNLVAGATKSLAVDMAVLVEGKTAEQLPEQLIGTIRLDKLDLKTAAYLDEVTGRILKPGELDRAHG